MTKFTQKRKSRFARADGLNYEGAPAFAYPPELELALRGASCFLEDTFYVAGSRIARQIAGLATRIGSRNPEYVLKCAGWLRNELGMRSVSLWLLAVMAGHPHFKGKPKRWLMKYAPSIMRRADEPAEALAAYEAYHPGEPVPRALYRACAARLERLTEYEAIKYRGQTRDWSLADAIRVCHVHPPTPAQEKLQAWVVTGELTPEGAAAAGLPQLASYLRINTAQSLDESGEVDGTTWEFLVSKFGSTPEVWAQAAAVMPPFAYVRNLRNLIEKSEVAIDTDRIVRAAQGKLMLPFRFLSARRAVEAMADRKLSKQRRAALYALDEALEASVRNMPSFGNTATLLDTSGSMGMANVSRHSDMTYDEIAKVFAAAAFKQSDLGVIIQFETTARVLEGFRRSDRLGAIVDRIKSGTLGHGTNTADALDKALSFARDLDTVLIFTDCQSWVANRKGDQAYAAALKLLKANPELRIVHWNLASYGMSDLPPHPRIFDLGGWSEQSLTLIEKWRRGAIVEEIEAWEPRATDSTET